MDKIPLNVLVTSEFKTRLREHAKARGLSMAAIIISATEDAIDDYERRKREANRA